MDILCPTCSRKWVREQEDAIDYERLESTPKSCPHWQDKFPPWEVRTIHLKETERRRFITTRQIQLFYKTFQGFPVGIYRIYFGDECVDEVRVAREVRGNVRGRG